MFLKTTSTNSTHDISHQCSATDTRKSSRNVNQCDSSTYQRYGQDERSNQTRGLYGKKLKSICEINVAFLVGYPFSRSISAQTAIHAQSLRCSNASHRACGMGAPDRLGYVLGSGMGNRPRRKTHILHQRTWLAHFWCNKPPLHGSTSRLNPTTTLSGAPHPPEAGLHGGPYRLQTTADLCSRVVPLFGSGSSEWVGG